MRIEGAFTASVNLSVNLNHYRLVLKALFGTSHCDRQRAVDDFGTSQKMALRLVAKVKKIILFNREIVNNNFISLIYLLTF